MLELAGTLSTITPVPLTFETCATPFWGLFKETPDCRTQLGNHAWERASSCIFANVKNHH